MRAFVLTAFLVLLIQSGSAQPGFEITIPVPGLTNVAGGHPLPDGGFVFGGELDDGLVVVRTDSTGAVLWTRALAEAANEEGLYDRSIAVSGGRIFMGGYAMGASTASRDGILHVLDLEGNVLSQRLIDVAGGSNAVHAITGMGNGALIAGRRYGAGSYDMLLQRMDIDGNITGSWGYGSSGWDWAYEAIHLEGGGMALVGYGDEVGGPSPSAYLVRTDAQGQELWARGIDGGSADEAYTVMEDAANGDLYIGGMTLGMGAPGTRGFITKFNAAGAHQWTRVIDNAFDVVGIVPLANGRYTALLRAQNILGGHGNYDALLATFSDQGDLLGNRLFGTASSEYPVSLSRTAGNGLLITGLRSVGASNEIYALLVDANGNGGCTGTSVNLAWTAYAPTVYTHASALQNGSILAPWPTEASSPALSRAFVCCTYPAEASFEAQPGDALACTFINTSTGGGTASWSIEGGTFAGDTVYHAFSAPGNYMVCLTFSGVCATDTACRTVAIGPNGIGDAADGTPLRIWPQPADGTLTVAADALLERVVLIDASGRVVMDRRSNHERTVQLDLGGLRPGAFVLRAVTDRGVLQRPVLRR